MLKIESLGKKFTSKWVFRRISWTLERREVLVVLGTNGAGKSTLLKIIAGLMAPTEGKIIRPRGVSHRILGYTALDLNLYPSLTLYEHLKLSRELKGLRCSAEELLEKVGLREYGDQRAEECSTGMRTRLKIALAIQTKPQILILDEPTASLDEEGKKLIDQILEEQKERGITVFATNDSRDCKYATHQLVLHA